MEAGGGSALSSDNCTVKLDNLEVAVEGRMRSKAAAILMNPSHQSRKKKIKLIHYKLQAHNVSRCD